MKNDNDAYLLSWDFKSLGDDDFLAYLIPFEGHQNVIVLDSDTPYTFPEPVLFQGNLRKLKVTDYPYTDVRWPLMSAKMISTLTSVGRFPHRLISVIMLDDSVPLKEALTKQHLPKPEWSLDRFKGVQLLEHLDVFDWDESEYERDADRPDLLVDVTKLRIKQVAGGLPPLFRLSADSTLLFVSAEARAALERENVAGVRFVALSDYPPRPR